MNATIDKTPEVSTVIMSSQEYENMRTYCRQKREAFKVAYAKDGIKFTASTMFLAFCGFLDF